MVNDNFKPGDDILMIEAAKMLKGDYSKKKGYFTNFQLALVLIALVAVLASLGSKNTNIIINSPDVQTEVLSMLTKK